MWKAYWIGVLICGVALPASAQWQLIDDFQQWEDGQIYMEVTDIGWHGSSPDGTDEYWFLEDPFDPDNITLHVYSSHPTSGYGTTWIQKELPGGGISPGETGTLFLRCIWLGNFISWNVGTADRELAYDDVTGLQITPGTWGDFNALIRLGIAYQLEHRDGGGYVSTNPQQFVNIGAWYSIWLVVENTWDMSTSPPTSTGVYALYVQGPGFGDGESPILIPVGTDPPKEKASFRRAPVDADGNPHAIIWAQFATNPGVQDNSSAWDPFLLDDFYFSQGRNLTDPISYGGYPANGSRDVDTGDWLGWINVTKAPYIWSYSLNGWIYMEEPAVDASGVWGYFYK